MRSLFYTSFIALALLISAGAYAPTAQAQDADAQPGGFYGAACLPDPGDPTVFYNPDTGQTCTPDTTASTLDPAAANSPNTLPPTPDMSSTYSTMMQWIMNLFAWLLGVAAVTLDNAVYYTVVTMGSYVHDLAAVGVAWRILRDIGNIVLIFGFLAIGIATILNSSMYGWAKSALPMLIVAAVFVNFSLFMSEAVIDTGNFLATQVYTQINGNQAAGSKDISLSSVRNEGISNKIMSQLGLQSIYSDSLQNKQLFKPGNSWLIGFMGILLFLVAAFVMFALAFILIARFVFLIFLIIIAPVAFAGWAVPKLKSTSSWWMNELLTQTFTAPVLLLLLYVALAVITDAKFLTGFCGSDKTCGANAWTGFITGGSLDGFAGMIISFLVAMGLLLFVVMASKRMSAFGGEWATRTAGKLSFGTAGSVGRIAVGWPANKFNSYVKTTRFARVPLMGTGLVKGLDKVAGASFDARGVEALGGLKALKMGDIGKPQKGGYKADLKERTEKRTKYAEGLKGRELTSEEKTDLAVLQNELSALQKQQGQATTRPEYDRIGGQIKEKEKEIEKKEDPTDKGSKRKYAKNLELGYLGLNDKSFFNKWINFASNTDAAKKIRSDAKKSSDDKELDTLRKALKKAGGDDAPAAPAAPAGGGGGAPAAGGGGAAPPAH